MTGLCLRVGTTGDGRMKSAVEMRPAVMPRGKFDPSKLKHGKGLRMSANGLTMGGNCEVCGRSMNDKFLFADQAL